MGFQFGNIYIKDNDYLEHDRTVFTSSMRTDYYNSFSELSKQIKQPKTKMFDIMIEMLMNNEEYCNEFLKKVKEY